MAFLNINNKLVNTNSIASVRCEHIESGRIIIHYVSPNVLHGFPLTGDTVEGQQAIDIIMQLNPSMLEGKRFKFIKHMWAMHNLFAHPALQILSWLGKSELGFKIHDATVPRPIDKYSVK